MADYYLGVLYLMKHNYGTARAAFQNSVFSLRENAKKDDSKATRSPSRASRWAISPGLHQPAPGQTRPRDQNFELAEKYDPRLKNLIARSKSRHQRPGLRRLGPWPAKGRPRLV